MKTKAEILESHIHPTKFLSSLSTETGKLAIFNAMEQYASQKSQAFAIWVEKNCVAVSPRKWEKVTEPDSGCYTTSELYAKFQEERKKK